MSQPSKASPSPSDNNSSDSESESHGSSEMIDIDLIQTRFQERVRLEKESPAFFTARKARENFVDKLHEEYDIEPTAIKNAIAKITPYIPVRHYRDTEGIMRPAWILPAEYDKPMADILPVPTTHALLLFEMRNVLDDSPKHLTERVKEQKAESDSLKEQQNSLIEAVRDLVKQQEAAIARSRTAEAVMETAVARLRLAEENMEADRERFRLAEAVIVKLEKDLEDERARAEDARLTLEETVVAQAENIRDTNEFIANGCNEDTAAYHRIKLRHLLNLTQARLAYCAGLLTTQADNRGASLRWRGYCKSLKDKQGPDGQKNARILQVQKRIQDKRRKEDELATEALITSGALELLVDDSRIRLLSDHDAHPGLLQQSNADRYRIAVKSHADAEGDEVLATHLTACLTFLLPAESSL